jgi:hypothetical protein
LHHGRSIGPFGLESISAEGLFDQPLPDGSNPARVFRIGIERVLLTDPQAVYFGGGEWETIRPWLGRVSIRELSRLSGVPERRLREYRQGARRPSAKRLGAITAALGERLSP